MMKKNGAGLWVSPGRERRTRLDDEGRYSLYSGAWNVGFSFRPSIGAPGTRSRSCSRSKAHYRNMALSMGAVSSGRHFADRAWSPVKAVGPSLVSAVNQLERAGLSRPVESESDLRVAMYSSEKRRGPQDRRWNNV